MKIFKISLEEGGYDSYDSCVLVAESMEKVEEYCKCNFMEYAEWDAKHEYPQKCCDGENFFIGKSQDWSIEYIGEADSSFTAPKIICSSFNAG